MAIAPPEPTKGYEESCTAFGEVWGKTSYKQTFTKMIGVSSHLIFCLEHAFISGPCCFGIPPEIGQ